MTIMQRYKIGAFAGNDIRIQGQSVDKVHAVIYQDEDGDILVEDRKSQYGTYVNNTRIQRFRLNIKDQIRCGKVPFDFLAHFKIKEGKITGLRPKNDYTEEFKLLEDVWDGYMSRTLDLGKSTGKQQRARQVFSSMGTLGLIVGIAVPSLPGLLRAALMGVGAIAAVYLVFAATSAKNLSKKQKAKEELNLYLTKNYLCPKCKAPLPKQPFEVLKQSKQHHCGAIWVKS